MAILSSIDGKFYDVPDEECGKYEVPADKVKGVLEAMDAELGGEHEGVAPYGAPAPSVVIHVSGNGAMVEELGQDADPEGGDVEAYGYGYGRHRHGHGGHYRKYFSPYWPRRRRRKYYYY